jgi:hypothetical protein
MSLATNVWARGQDLLALTIAFGSAAADTGVVTWGSQLTLQNRGSANGVPTTALGTSPEQVTLSGTSVRGNLDYLRIAGNYTLEQIMALDATQESYTEIMMGVQVSVGEIMKQSGNVLPLGFWNPGHPYVQVCAVFGNTVHYRGYIFTMTRENLQDGAASFGKNTIELTLKPNDLGVPIVQYFEV